MISLPSNSPNYVDYTVYVVPGYKQYCADNSSLSPNDTFIEVHMCTKVQILSLFHCGV